MQNEIKRSNNDDISKNIKVIIVWDPTDETYSNCICRGGYVTFLHAGLFTMINNSLILQPGIFQSSLI